ncbi:tyrosine-type recombinase/integrase [Paraliobacillus ryukyuensis]|uniref:tyrosine-type recombinase/integrase n=1 Tax=Paraliobacillus ryukyuensis TaxID=200904 RepID=UPI0009A8BE88|nr:site-specific integrase [Paraliobacillus ryukyuensis]
MDCQQITLKSGEKRWECVADAPPDPVTGERKQIRRRAKKQKDAKAKVELELKKRQQGLIDDKIAKKITFKQAAEHWLSVYKLSGVKKSTIDVKVDCLKALNNNIGAMPMRNISHVKYQRMINKLFKEDKYERNTILKFHACARQVFKQAIKDRLIEQNPAIDVVIPKKVKTVEELENDSITEKFLEQEELEEFLYTAKQYNKTNDYELFYLLSFSGMRPGEVLALKWSDVNFETNEIRVTKTLYNKIMKSDTYELNTTKTNKARTFSIDEGLISILKKMKTNQSKDKLRFKKDLNGQYHDGNFVFRNQLGYPFNYQQLYRATKRILSHTSIEKPITPHCFRHTHISLLTESGVDLPTIMDRVGHEDEKTTRNIYTHVTKRMKESASEKMKLLYQNVEKNIQSKKM